jgi:hypothetical protein
VCRSLPDFEQRIYSPHKIAAVVAELAAQGVSASTALEGTGLDASHLTAVGTKVSYRQLDQVFRNALHLSANPAIALRAGQRLHITAYGMYGYALMSSATYTEAFAFAARYSSVIGPLSNTVFSRDDKTVTYTCEPLHWPNPAEDIYRFVVEFALSTHLTVARDLRGQSGRFSRVDLVYPAPAHAGAYEQLFECPVLFRQRNNELRCDAAWVDDPVAFADSITHAMARASSFSPRSAAPAVLPPTSGGC